VISFILDVVRHFDDHIDIQHESYLIRPRYLTVSKLMNGHM
jgi:hypothetical protein